MNTIKYHDICGEIDDEMLEKIFDILNDREIKRHVIYFTSVGGNKTVAVQIKTAIENYCKQEGYFVYVVFHHQVFSSAFWLMFSLQSGISFCIPEGLLGMDHQDVMAVLSNGKGPKNPGEWTKARAVQYWTEQDLKHLKKIGLSKEEINKYADGKDIWFDCKRMQELVKTNGIKSFEDVSR